MKVKLINYQKSCGHLKRRIKSFILENASMVDEVCILQKELAAARSERLALIEKLMFYEGLEKGVVGQVQYLNEKNDHLNNTVAISHSKEKCRGNGINKISTAQQNTFPLKLDNVLIHSIGEIISSNPNFHTVYWIYPVGYVATRIYAHPRDPRKKCVFTCKILNNAGYPQFQLIPDNDLDGVFFGETANKCHLELLNSIQASTNDSLKIELKPKGEEFFGLSNQQVQNLLLSDIKLNECIHFKGFMSNDEKELCENKDPSLSFEQLQTYIKQY